MKLAPSAKRGEIMKASIKNVVIAGFVSIAAAAFMGCADTETTEAYNPPVQVVHVPTAVTNVPPTANSTTVTTQYGKLHSVDNVFVIDGSLHVTNGGFNPSLTILALAFRSSEYIAKEWKGTRFR